MITMKQCTKSSFWDTKNVTRLIAVFLMFFSFEAEAQNNALNFNGYNNNNPNGLQNKVTCGNSIGNFGTTNFTIEFNVKTTSTDGNAEWLVTKRSVCGHASFFNIGITNGIVFLEIDQDTNGTNHNDLISNTAVNDGTWHHVALVRSGTSLTFYIDGVASGSKTNSFITNVNNADNLTIGGFGSTCSTNQNFVGSLDELRIWNIARTQSQIQAAKNTELVGNETGLITYYNFNQGTANASNNVTTLLDKTANTNNGTLNNFTLSGTTANWVAGNSTVAPVTALNNALNFDGVDDYVKINNTTSANFTIEAWVKSSVPSHTGWAAYQGSPIAWADKGGGANDFTFSILNNHLAFFDGSNDGEIEGTTNICDGNWHRVAIVRTAGSTSYLYVDGVQDGSGTSGSAVLTDNPFIEFGGNTLDGVYYNGNIDELRIWNSARSQSQIQSNMINELIGTETGLINYYNFNQGIANANNSGVTTLNDLTSNQNNGTLNNFSLSGTTSNWVAVTGVINATVAGTITANQTITSLTSTGVTTIPGDQNMNSGGWFPVSPSMSYGDMPWDQMPAYNEAQSFKASNSASWTSLKINVQNVNQPGDFTLQVFSGDGVYGSTILSQTVSIYNNGINNFIFSSPIALTAGQFYTFQLSSNGNANVSIDGSGSSLPFGTFYQNGNGSGGSLYFENTYQINNANWNNLTLTGNTGNVLYWQKSTDAGFGNPTTIASTSTTLYSGLVGNLSATTYFRAVVKFGGFAAANTNTVKITVSINSSNTSQIKANQCGVTLASLNANINADYVAGYQAYRFEVSNGGSVNTVDVNKYNFSLTQTPGITYGTTYGVRVAVKIGGTWGEYGVSCNVTTPVLSSSTVITTKINPVFCGSTLAALDTKIAAVPVYAATGYRFEITKGGITTFYNSSVYNFRLADAGVAAYGTTYTIRVAAQVNGVYGNYGASCNVTTPTLTSNVVPTTALLPAICSTTLSALNTKIGATPVYNATGYRFEITANNVTTIYDSAVYNFKLSQTAVNVSYNTVYAIRVAALINGVYGNFGTSCTVTTPADPNIITRLKAKSFEVSAYPNPFDTAFNLNVDTPSKEEVTIAVYDMMGKLIETHQVNPTEVTNLQIGNNYAAGIYNVIVSQANEMQAIRLIRK